MRLCLCIALGFLIDLLLGDPHWMPHPVVGMGWLIQKGERLLRRLFPKTSRGERWAGAVLALLLPSLVFFLSSGLLGLAGWIHPLLSFVLETLWCWQTLAIKGLRTESERVKTALLTQGLSAARTAVSRIVGRDTAELSAQGVTKAAVETISENFSDGVVAPLFYLFWGGAPLGLCYKAINTMDSMIGYRNERYLFFGWAAARLDDTANFLPSRLAALFWILSAACVGQDWRGALRIWRRDRLCHKSPNSAQTESACAGALGIQLGGPAYYFGHYVAKPTIGDSCRSVEPMDISRANRCLYVGSFMALVIFWGIRLCIFWIW